MKKLILTFIFAILCGLSFTSCENTEKTSEYLYIDEVNVVYPYSYSWTKEIDSSLIMVTANYEDNQLTDVFVHSPNIEIPAQVMTHLGIIIKDALNGNEKSDILFYNSATNTFDDQIQSQYLYNYLVINCGKINKKTLKPLSELSR